MDLISSLSNPFKGVTGPFGAANSAPGRVGSGEVRLDWVGLSFVRLENWNKIYEFLDYQQYVFISSAPIVRHRIDRAPNWAYTELSLHRIEPAPN